MTLNRSDEISLRRILNYPPRGIGDTSVERLGTHALAKGWTLWQTIERVDSLDDIPTAARAGCKSLERAIGDLRKRLVIDRAPASVAGRELCEKVGIYADLNEFTKKEVNEQTLYIADLSAEHGGSLGRHKSHQNGLDADVAFYFNNKSFHGNFASAVAIDKPHPNWRAEEQWQLFKSLIGTKIVDRIFINKVLKKSLCDLAQAKGELQKGKEEGLAAETLRRLRADKEHNTHFHLRIKCSKKQLRCRQMAEPPAGSGCF